MATVLFCWELGAGFGHLMPHREVLGTLREKGHAVHVAVRDLTRAVKAFDGQPFHYWQAPTPQNKTETVFNPTINFAQILHNTGLGDPTGLAARIAAWRNIFAVTRPQVALVDYCPTALLAMRKLKIPPVVTGTGFFIPPNISPFPAFPMVANRANRDKLAQEEKELVAGINAALEKHGIPKIGSLAQIFHDVAAKIFRALPEFDHYPKRGPAEFLGLPPDPPRPATAWPAGNGPKVFAYLKPFANLELLLTQLQQRGLTVLIASDGIPKPVRHKYSSPTMRFVPPSIDILQMGRESHLAITNANLTTSVRLLLQGCPVLTIPLQLEQMLVASNLQRLGVGQQIRHTVAEDIVPQLTEMLGNPKYRQAAQLLAAKYKDRPDDYVEKAVAVLERFLPSTNAVKAPHFGMAADAATAARTTP